MKSDSELDEMGREPKHEHEWSEWFDVLSGAKLTPYLNSSEVLSVVKVKIRVCKVCKQAQFEVV